MIGRSRLPCNFNFLITSLSKLDIDTHLPALLQVIPGDYGFITQLIEGRDLKKRPTEFRVDKVLQPFDGSKFNFMKIVQEEALFRFEEGEKEKSKYFYDAPVSASDSPNVIAINVSANLLLVLLIQEHEIRSVVLLYQVSPIGYGHVLLIPRILDLLPQRIERESLLLALYLSKEAGNLYFKVGYNSLGAFATINHLHFQVTNHLIPLV